MARIRTIKPEFFTSEQVVECSPMARLLFVGMWCFCDDGGVHPASAVTLKMEVFPADSISVEDVRGLVSELESHGLVSTYSVGTKSFWRVLGWHHQKIDRPTYKHPNSKEFGEESARSRRTLGETSTPESNGVESNGKKEQKSVRPSLVDECLEGTSYNVPEVRVSLSEWIVHYERVSGTRTDAIKLRNTLSECRRSGWNSEKLIDSIKFTIGNTDSKRIIAREDDLSKQRKNGSVNHNERATGGELATVPVPSIEETKAKLKGSRP